jgi:O-antigen/teichoic acid export membrane protein
MPSRFARNSAFSMIAGLCTTFGSFLSSVFVARMLGVEGTGVVAYSVWLASIIVILADAGVPATLARFIPELNGRGEDEDARRLTSYLLRRLLIGATAAFVVVAAFTAATYFGEGAQDRRTDDHALMALLVGMLAFSQVLANFTLGHFRGSQRFSRVATFTSISMAVQLPAIAIGASLFGSLGAFAGYVLGAIIPAFAALRFLRGDTELKMETRDRVRKYALYTWAAAIASALVWSRVEIYFLEKAWGVASVGLFTVGMTLSSLATQGPMLLTGALLGYFSERFGQNALPEMRSAYATATRLMAFLVFPACFGAAAIMPVLLPMLYGPAFAGAAPAAMILVAAAAFGATAVVGTNIVFAMERSDFIFLSSIAGAVLSVTAGLAVIPTYGLLGAAVGRAVIQFAMVGMGIWFISQRLRCPTPFRELALLLVAALFSSVVAGSCISLLPGRPFAGLASAVVAGAIAYILAVRLLGALPQADLERLRSVAAALPRPIFRIAEPILIAMGGKAAALP